MKRRVAVLISGGGSNLQALLDAAQAPDYPAEIVLVLSNKAEAFGLQRAANAGVPTVVVSHGEYANRESYDRAVQVLLEAYDVELVCLAGFMRLLSPWFVQEWHDRMLNIHPSLLPSFKGLHTHRQALQAGVKLAGCTVHLVRAEMDVGPIVAQAAVPVLDEDTEETLAARVLVQEHQLYPQALRWLAEGRLQVREERVFLRR